MKAFSRSQAIFSAIAAALAAGVQMVSIANNPKFSYNSRGHGRSIYSGKGCGNAATDWHGILKGQTNGERECERRMRQMAKASA